VLVDAGSVILERRIDATGIDQLRPHVEYDGLV
jgi:hypothetical protein